MRDWDDFDGVDTESTKLTGKARSVAERSVRAELAAAGRVSNGLGQSAEPGYDYAIAMQGSATRVLYRGYLTEFRGQSSASGHGKQGCDPKRVASLREFSERTGLAVRIVFVDSGSAWQAVWLGRVEPEIVNLDNDTAHRRQGWRVREMIRGSGLVDFPDEPPPVAERAQEALL